MSWSLEPQITFLNHGSFGACPQPIQDRQQELREELEREPVRFMTRRYHERIHEAREALAGFLGSRPQDLAFVVNATHGVNAVLRSLSWKPGDQLLTTDHAYNACKNALDFIAQRTGAEVVVAQVPFPIEAPEQVLEAVISQVTARTRLAMLDHVTSSTALVFPIKRLVAALAARGVDTLVDGAHAPGMVELDVPRIGAAYYTGNCHKWLCGPKSSAFLWVHPDKQAEIRPLSISHGASEPPGDRSRFLVEFDWTGTMDPTPIFCLPEVLAWMASQREGGWPEVMDHNRSLILEGRRLLCEQLQIPLPAPDAMIGSIASVPIPDYSPPGGFSAFALDPWQEALMERHQIQVPIFYWPRPPRRWIRISGQLYNQPAHYQSLAQGLAGLL